MTTVNINLKDEIAEYVISHHKTNLDKYFTRIIKEDMLLNEINESKKSGINNLISLDDLDN